MEILIKTDQLKKAIFSIQSICQKKTISEITQNIELEIEKKNINIKSTDLEIYVEVNIEIEEILQITNNSKTIINGKFFFDIIKDIEDQYIKIQINNNNCFIKSKHSNIRINILNTESFPINELKIENILKINNKHIVKSIHYCGQISQTNIEKTTTPTILFQFTNTEFKATATDGHCLSHIKINKATAMIDEEFSFLISKKASMDCKKIIETFTKENEETFLGRSSNKITFTGNNFIISIKSINEKFPNYQKILQNEYKTSITCQATSFIKITKRLSLFTENKFLPATMKIEEETNKILFKIENNTIGKIEEDLIFTKEEKDNNKNEKSDIAVAIFPPYILKGAQETQNNNDTINIKISAQQKPILFYQTEDNIEQYFLVMPMIAI